MSLRRLCLLIAALLCVLGLSAADAVNDLAAKGRPALDAQLAKDQTNGRALRGNLSAADRKNYIAAVLCLMGKPSKLDQSKYPGAKTRYDDFVAVHINQTLYIHGTGNFLSWHRYFTWSYELALRNECGYNGTQPYWDWGVWANDPERSPIFDGSDTSMSGNGQKITHKSNGISPAGNGGGCVQTGPFKNFTVNLGPVVPMADPAPPKNPRSDGFGYNPRCLRRDISNYLTTRYAKTSDIVALITNYTDVGSFQTKMQAGDGVHGAGHFTIAGDPGADFFNSPGDPAFWLLHSMIDRVWYIWQIQNFSNRQLVISGGTTMMGSGPAQTLDDLIDLNVVANKVYKIRDLVSTVDGPFCYVYE
ncbi:Di-copper centre-containing protein [Glonium stellatum]|uniref:Di-copper centre-containing protein n=1 Tax=Glonium stellatum TaxID=574774 RepID=A0A8E2F2V8_9PEZI|nr:Di-copper centre-containing protein [Glonium stellatum]